MPLQFDFNKSKVTGTVNRDPTIVDLHHGPDSSQINSALSEARERMLRKVSGVHAQLGAALGERKKSIAMIENRAAQLLRFYKAAKRVDVVGAYNALGLSRRSRKGKKLPRTTADLILETMFGWLPLIGDVYNSVQILQSGVPPLWVWGSSRLNSETSYSPGTHYTWYLRYSTLSKVGCRIRINNPNLHLANQLGLVNPVSIAYELIPFSFVANYFFTIEEFLGSFTEFHGLSVLSSYGSYLSRCDQRRVYFNPSIGHYFENSGYILSSKRSLGLPPGPELRLRDPWILSPTRALTSIALLTQFLSKGR